MFGRLRMTSVSRINTESTQPPRKPATIPTVVPTTTAMTMREKRDAERDTGTVGESGEHVAAETVGAEQMLDCFRRAPRPAESGC